MNDLLLSVLVSFELRRKTVETIDNMLEKREIRLDVMLGFKKLSLLI